MNSDLITKHAEVMKMANDYLKTVDENILEHNKRLINIYITMLGIVGSGKLDSVSLLRFNYFYCKENKSEKKKELNVGNIFNSTRTIKETVDNIIALTELTPKDFFEEEQPYRITVDAILDTKTSVEILVYEFSDEVGNFVLSKNDRAIDELKDFDNNLDSKSNIGVFNTNIIKKLMSANNILKENEEKEYKCKCHIDEIDTPIDKIDVATKIKDDKVEKVKAINDLLETYDAILKYGKPFTEHERITRRRKEFLEDFKNMLTNVETVAKNDISVEVESIASGNVVRSRLNEYMYNIFRKDVVEYNYYGESLARFIEKTVPNSNEDPRKIVVYLIIPCYPIDENEYDYKKVELFYFIKRDNEWIYHESLNYRPIKGDK